MISPLSARCHAAARSVSIGDGSGNVAAPCSAALTALRNTANSSRPMPIWLDRQVGGSPFARGPLGGGTSASSAPAFASSADDVAVAHHAERAAGQDFGRHVDRRRHLARRARHAAVGDQRDVEALRPAARRAAASARAVPACRSRAGPGSAPRRRSRASARRLVKACHARLPANRRRCAGASTTRCSGLHGRDLDHARGPRLPLQQLQAAVRLNGLVDAAQHRCRRRSAPAPARQTQLAVVEERLLRVARAGPGPRRCARLRAAGRHPAARGSRSRCRRPRGSGSRRPCRSGRSRASSGTTCESSSKSFQSITMPAARAIATRCSVWLVEPPVASSADDAR